MNIHPIFVHFPIALLTIYAIMEIIRFKKLDNLPYYFYIKATFVIIGSLSASLALQTGEVAEHIFRGDSTVRGLINMHSAFAEFSSYIFAILSVLYAIAWINRTNIRNNPIVQKIFITPIEKLWVFATKITDYILSNNLIMIIIGIIGLATITITGALGGAIVYGPKVDPVVNFIYNLVM